MTDSVAVDAKRILLRYGAPIAILDNVSESHRIEFAREIAKTMLPQREPRLRQLLAEHGYTDAEAVAKVGSKKAKKATSKALKPASGKPRSGKVKSTKARRGTKVESTKAKAGKKKR